MLLRYGKLRVTLNLMGHENILDYAKIRITRRKNALTLVNLTRKFVIRSIGQSIGREDRELPNDGKRDASIVHWNVGRCLRDDPKPAPPGKQNISITNAESSSFESLISTSPIHHNI